ncbi:HMG box transcription factor [Lithospermum erythrorhizon]|uniref:HMG box transcription factor n=1 Tax=Lithospermum erythrorhizon TaxID=34254 RepID=A0AAV3NNS1_LITER
MNSMRIYIGGLGETVTRNDITKTFSAPNLGTVINVDLVRTKGRSFAYLDFIPSSHKGLAKLFSTYNGCKWKGGSLRLEKAKEHYLQQLRREWEEDSEVASTFHKEDGDAIEDALHTVKSKKLPDLDKMQLNIFFPRLRKVKAVPFKGTGKHKYSFQRVEPRVLPVHFCDCEEHSGAQDVDKAHERHDGTKIKEDSYVDTKIQEDSYDDYDNENGEINEQELTMMSSVMNKLFEREIFSEANRKCGSSTMKLKNVDAIGDLAAAEDQPDQMSDEDGLIINIVGGSKNNASWLGNNLATSNQDLPSKELHNSKSRLQNLQTSKQKTSVPVGEKRKQLKGDEKRTVSDVAGRKIRKIMPSDKDEKANLSHSKGTQTSDISVSKKLSDGCENSAKPQTNVAETINHEPGQLQRSEQRGLSTKVDSSTFEVSRSAPSGSPGIDLQSGSDILGTRHTPGEEDNTSSSVQIIKPKVSAEGSSGSGKLIADKTTRGPSWFQKSSWTQLVKGTESSSFSISHILPQTNFDKQVIQQPTVIDFSSPNQTTRVALPQGQSKTVLLGAHENLVVNTFANNVGNFGDLQADPEKNPIDGHVNEASTLSASNRHPLAAKQARTDEDETFSFVRTAASMKEFAKLKASLSASLKKNGDKKDR